MPMLGPRRSDGAAVLFGLGGVGAIVGVMRLVQVQPNPTIAALLLLLVVLAAATVAQLRVAIGISVAAMLAFNFFLLPPFHTFRIADPQNWVALFVFVVVAIVGSQLSATVQRRARESEARQLEVAIERSRALAERKTAEALSQRASLASALLASFSHDLRTPVTAVRVAVTNLQDLTLSPEERRIQAQLAVQQLDRLSRLFEDILDMGRIDAHAVKPERQWVLPSDVVEAALTYAAPALCDRKLDIEADALHEIEIDPRLTSTALRHLLENAARHSPTDTPIEIRATADVDGVRFVVRDHGEGLEQADLENVFEPFYRGAKARHTPGTGLGLAITRGLLVAEGGRVWCENIPDGGARFTIMLPASVRALGAVLS